jgi:hypothetical protein
VSCPRLGRPYLGVVESGAALVWPSGIGGCVEGALVLASEPDGALALPLSEFMLLQAERPMAPEIRAATIGRVKARI